MGSYLIRRLLLTLPVLLGVATAVFFMSHLIPGDTVDALLAESPDPSVQEAMRQYLGLDRPVGQQYVDWLGRALRGDLGQSLITGRAVAGEISRQLPATLELAVTALLLSVLAAIPIGVVSAAYRNSWMDNIGRVVAIFGIATPNFWLGTMLILIFSLWLRWLPSGGYAPLLTQPWESLRYLILPAAALGASLMAGTMRMTRSAMLEVLRQDYVQTARAKGLPNRRVLYGHALRNALIPVLTHIGIQAGRLLGGVVIIEQVFSRPGVGRVALLAIGQRDYPMVQGAVLFITLVFVLVNLAVDLLYSYVNPRIRYQ